MSAGKFRKRWWLSGMVLFPFLVRADTIPPKIIQQEIGYHTDKASEVTLVWGINEWKLPPREMWPSGSYLKKGFVYSPMQTHGDSFNVVINVPDKTKIDYVLWLSKDKKGRDFDWWDNNFKDNYHVYATSNKVKSYNTNYDELIKHPPFNILRKGVWFLAGVLGFHFILWTLFRNRFLFIFKQGGNFYYVGLALSLFCCSVVVRMQLGKLFNDQFYYLFAAGYFDLIYITALTSVFLILLALVKNRRPKNLLAALFIFMIFLSALLELLNIDLIRLLGRPLNYQWFYYSGFLKSNDAKNALQENLKPELITNIIELLLAVFLFAYPLAFFTKMAEERVGKRRTILALTACCFCFLVIGKFQLSTKHFQIPKLENPIISFGSSVFSSATMPALFTMQVPDVVRKEVADMHRPVSRHYARLDKPVKHIILFVLESTPAEYVRIYNSQFNVTPNMDKWKGAAKIFDNIYAACPSTVTSLFSLSSGLYPWISYRSVTYEYPEAPFNTLASLAKSKQYRCGAISSTSWEYQKMGVFLKNHDFNPVEEYTDIDCNRLVYTSQWNSMDGVDDRCTADHLFHMINQNPDSASIDILWTMQTHYPYFFSEEERPYVKDNPSLNRYLNALQNVDEAFGNLMDSLQLHQLLAQTMVIVIGDHGEAFGRHDQTSHASRIYEENIHIPCVIYQPGLFHGESDKRAGSNIDIPATIAHAAGLSAPEEWQGTSLFSTPVKNRTFFFCPYSDFLFGTRKDNWKLIFNASDNTFELYDLANDPEETNNLSGQHPDLVKKEFEYIAAWVQYQNAAMDKLLNQSPETPQFAGEKK